MVRNLLFATINLRNSRNTGAAFFFFIAFGVDHADVLQDDAAHFAEAGQLKTEHMTQLKVGISQMFPRGDSLEIRQEQLKLQASQYPYQREDRKGKLTVQIAQLWLEAYKAQESIALIEKTVLYLNN